jgi:hypothetical protein
MTRARSRQPRNAELRAVRRALAWTGWAALVAVAWFGTYAVLVFGGR